MDNSAVIVLESTSMALVPVRLGFEDLYRLEYPGLVAVASAMTAATDALTNALKRMRVAGRGSTSV